MSVRLSMNRLFGAAKRMTCGSGGAAGLVVLAFIGPVAAAEFEPRAQIGQAQAGRGGMTLCDQGPAPVTMLGAGRFTIAHRALRSAVRCLYNSPGQPLVLPSIGSTANGTAAPTPGSVAPAAPAPVTAPPLPVAVVAPAPALPPTAGSPAATGPSVPVPALATPVPAPGTPTLVMSTIDPGFAYYPPGQLHPKDKERGRVGDRKVYVPDMIFPLRLQPGTEHSPRGKHAHMNSQVRNFGGEIAGDQCNPKNYDPTLQQDNLCEQRDDSSHDMPLCPTKRGHQGQDIRPPACNDQKWEAVAVVDGIITFVRAYTSSVILTGNDGTEYVYLHMHPSTFKVTKGQRVTQGTVLGRVSNIQGGGPGTTYHLHFQVSQQLQFGRETKRVYIPIYTSLLNAYRKQKGLGSGVDPQGNLVVDMTVEIGASSDVAQPQAPFVSFPIPNITGNDGRPIPGLSVAQYFKARATALPVKYAATGLPSGLSIAPATGAITGSLGDNASRGGSNGSYTVAIVATDSLGDSATRNFTITASVTPPVIGTATRGKFYKDGDRVLLDAGAAYLNPSGATLTFTAVGLPPGLTINAKTGRINGRLNTTASQGGNGGVYAVTVSAADGRNAGVNERFTVTVQNQTNPLATPPDLPPPVIALALPSLRLFNGQEITTINAASGFSAGGDGKGRLTYSAPVLPSGLEINASTGQITGTMKPDASRGGNNGSYVVTVAAENKEGESVSQSFIITARNQPPTLAAATVNTTYKDGETVDLSIKGAFSSPDPTELTYSAQGLPEGLALDPKSGDIKGRLKSDASIRGTRGIYTVAATVDDGKGGVASETFTITAVPVPPPVAPVPFVVVDPPTPPVVVAPPIQPPAQPVPTPPVVVVIPPVPQPPPAVVVAPATPEPAVVIAPPAPPPVAPAAPIVLAALPPQGGTEGTALIPVEAAAMFTAGNSSSGPLSYRATGLPRSLTIDDTSGQITGLLAVGSAIGGVNGRYDVTVTAEDRANRLSASQSFSIRVVEAVKSVSVPSTPPVVVTLPTPDANDLPPVVIAPQPDAPKAGTWTGWVKDKASGTWQWVSGFWTKKK
jgi:murein DD-endopeptidase MepM/ murein hydrolase activator NlpD